MGGSATLAPDTQGSTPLATLKTSHRSPTTTSGRSTTRPAARTPLRPVRAEAPDSAPAAKTPKGKAPATKTPSKRAKKAQKLGGLTGQNKIIAAPGAAASRSAREIALRAAEAGLERKALNVEILDVAGQVDYADLLVLMTGTSDRHVAAIVTAIEDELRKSKIRAIAVEGLPTANWVLADFDDVVIHVFQEDARGLYDLDRNPRPVADAYKMLLQEYGQITIVPHGELFEVTERPATLKVEV
ncbi:MAG: ribosome silencing factor [Myxococcales bacterium]|nr:MAG: ribosome silencing factor [Myxococcales bacterium]